MVRRLARAERSRHAARRRSWRGEGSRARCWRCGCWRPWLDPAPGRRATGGGERWRDEGRRAAGRRRAGLTWCVCRRRAGPGAAAVEEERCTVERRADLTYAEFMQHYAFLRPVILQGLTNNSRFRALCSRERLLASFGDNVIRLSTANTYSYQKVDLPFQEYVERLLHPQNPTSLGNDTLYFFGDNNFTEWASLFRHYSPPPFRLLGTTPAYSFGIAGAGSGVPFHWHGPGFSEVIYGRKVLYFPDRWWHATLNLDTSVFISTFLG
uniref:JmjC domain-containing protein 8 n=1 Tax=Castor canadensis TaxID=51338 RepID=A0A8C0WU32_CASCN